jgi:AAA domain-containing protein
VVTTRRPTRKPARRPARKPQTRGNIHAVQYDRPRIVVEPEGLQDFNESIKWLVYGNSGVGKTVLASFAPNAYFLSTEKGVVSARRVGSPAKLIRAMDWDHIEAGLDWADEHLTRENWLIIDSLSKMQTLLLRWWLQIQNSENAARDIDIPQIQDHQKWQNMLLRFVSRIVDAEYNAIFTATSMHKEDPEGESLVLPNIVGKDYTISNNVCAEMDIVSCLRVAPRENVNEPRQAILTNDTFPPYFGKDRFRALPRWEMIEDGAFDVIQDMIRDIMKLSPEERQAAKAEGR